MKKKNQDSKYWFRLDTSAQIYPAIESPEHTNIFRIWAKMEEEVDLDTVKKALEIIKPRFPYYNVHLRTGLFWHYFEQNDNPSKIWPDTPQPCERLYPIYNNGYLYLIRIYKNNLSMECSHVLTDGGGALEFLKTLITHYLILLGKIDAVPKGIMDIHEKPDPEEYEDAFKTIINMEKDNLDNSPRQRSLFNTDGVFQHHDTLLPLGKYKIIIGTIPLKDLKELSKKYNCTITELLASLYVEALIHIQYDDVKNTKKHRSIGMEIPVNLRMLYPIKSMRNFSLFVVPRFDPKKIDKFEDIIDFLKPYMKEHITKEYLITMAQDNYELTQNKIIKWVPIFIKNFIIKYLSNTQGHAQFSGAISNLGAIRLPEELNEHIDDMGVLLGPTYHCLTGCGVVGFKDHIHINFGRINKHPRVEKHIFRRLVEMGAHVSIRSN
ncbi:MAG: hypothetical protein U9O95_07895 [Candidatus Marinimicrobia bacterium]|nr:hypothetical protein [Candidatus Neomarinimicrobiota bacterium]